MATKKEPTARANNNNARWLLGATTAAGGVAAGWIANSLLHHHHHEQPQEEPPLHPDVADDELRATIENLERQLAHTASSNQQERKELEQQILALQEELAGVDKMEAAMQDTMQIVEALQQQLEEIGVPGARRVEEAEVAGRRLGEHMIAQFVNTMLPDALAKVEATIVEEQRAKKQLEEELAMEREEANTLRNQRDVLEQQVRKVYELMEQTQSEVRQWEQRVVANHAQQLEAQEEMFAQEKMLWEQQQQNTARLEPEAHERQEEEQGLRLLRLELAHEKEMRAQEQQDMAASVGRLESEAQERQRELNSLRAELEAYRGSPGADKRRDKVLGQLNQLELQASTGRMDLSERSKAELMSFIDRILQGQKEDQEVRFGISRELENQIRHSKELKQGIAACMGQYRAGVDRAAEGFMDQFYAFTFPGSRDPVHKKQVKDQFMVPLQEALNAIPMPC